MSIATEKISKETWQSFLPNLYRAVFHLSLIIGFILTPIVYFDLGAFFVFVGTVIILLAIRGTFYTLTRDYVICKTWASLGFNRFPLYNTDDDNKKKSDFDCYTEAFSNIKTGLNKLKSNSYYSKKFSQTLYDTMEYKMGEINPSYRWDLIDEFMSHNFNISPICLITPLIETLSFEDLDKISQKVLINKSNEELVDYVAQMIRLLNESKNPKKDELINHTLTLFNKSIPNFIELLKVCDAISIDKELNKMLSLKLELNLKKDDSNFHGKVSKI